VTPDIRDRIAQLDAQLYGGSVSPADLYELGGLKLSAGDSIGAIAAYEGCVLFAPDKAVVYNNLGVAQMKGGRYSDAITSFEAALSCSPEYHRPLVNLGKALRAVGRSNEAIEHARHALRLKPDYPPALVNLGTALLAVGDFEAAERTLRRALQIEPNLTEARISLGELLSQLGRVQETLSNYEQAIARDPDHAGAHFCYAMTLLRIGRYPEGWAEYEWRWRQTESALYRDRRHTTVPLWLGREHLAGKTILLHAEQGFGDALQFCRYARLVCGLGAKVILEVHRSLQRLMHKLEGVAQVISRDDPTPEVDFQCPLMTLPLAFKTTVETIPPGQRYLAGEPELVERWRLRLGERHGLRVGLVWSGGSRPQQPDCWWINTRRNIGLEMLADLRHPKIDYVSLQKGQPAEAEPQELRRRGWIGPSLIDYTHALTDFAETAALMENLDVVVSVDTATAHLAAALGKPTWILNRFDSCWRWLIDRSDSPWYPSVRLFRQCAPGMWDSALQQVRTELFRLDGS